LRAEQSVEEFYVRFSELGVTLANASAFLGVDLAAEVASARVQARQSITALGQDSPVSAVALESLYSEIDRGGISRAEVVQRVGGFVGVVGDAVTHERLMQGRQPWTHTEIVTTSARARSQVVADDDSGESRSSRCRIASMTETSPPWTIPRACARHIGPRHRPAQDIFGF
jgi:hypothetical protein